MGLPDWWDDRRFGILFEPSLASVPGWAPIGDDAVAYRMHLGESPGPDGDVAPMIEVVAHHRDRWGHIEDFDAFVELLEFGEFDAAAWTALAVEAGAGYAATVARHHDGWRWWDASATPRTVVGRGPRRDVVDEFASACAADDLAFGLLYSTLGGGTDDDATDATTELVELIDRHHPSFLRLHTEFDDAVASGIVERVHDHVPRAVVDAPPWMQRFRSDHVIDRYDWMPPDDATTWPWELRRSLGSGYGWNRAERDDHLLSPNQLIALLCEVVAKGGHLLLSVPVTADGVVPASHARRLRAAGTWIRRHRDLIDRGRPWRTWGDDEVVYLDVDGAVHVVDVAGRGRFAALHRGVYRVDEVTLDGTPLPFVQNDDGLQVDVRRPGFMRRGAEPRSEADLAVYRVSASDVSSPAALFPLTRSTPIDLQPVLDGTAPGVVVQLGDGVYRGPAAVPAGVTLRGLGAARTVIEVGAPLSLGDTARLEHLRVAVVDDRGRATATATLVDVVGSDTVVLGCTIDGVIAVQGDGASVRATRAAGIVASDVDRATIARCDIAGRPGGTGIAIRGGGGHTIESCDIRGHEHAIHLEETSQVVVRANELAARRSGVWLERADSTSVRANFVKRTVRGIDLDGGTGAVVDANAVCDGDSGCVVRAGATASLVTGNTWERCRIGVLVWDTDDVTVNDNESFDLHDAELVTGP